MSRIKKRVHHLVAAGRKDDFFAWFVEIFLVVLIILNVTCLILETVQTLQDDFHTFFYYFDVTSVIIFTAEYVLRVWSITEEERYADPVSGRIKYMLSPIALCDLLSILPFYLPFIHADLRSLRLFRFLRLLRVFKLARYVKALASIRNVLIDKRHELLVSFVLMLFVLIISSALMFSVEHDAQPEKFSSIPATMWWGIATLTTVGYGDVYPITSLGKLLGGAITLVGIGLFAVPTAIIASGFSENFMRKRKTFICPHCQNEIELGHHPHA
jgi:voltage-gated potassium channel